jgi:hypothetical protein
MFKFELGQEVFCMNNNRVCSGQVTGRKYVDSNSKDTFLFGGPTHDTLFPFGPTGIVYQTCHGTFSERLLFSSKEELIASL